MTRRFRFDSRKGVAYWTVILCVVVGSKVTASELVATLDRDTVTVGESANLSLILAGSTLKQLPQVPTVKDLSINYLGQSSQFSFVNGRSSSTVSYNYLVRAARAGDYTIPSIVAVVDGVALKSEPVTLKVLKSGEAGSTAELVGQTALLKLVVPRTNIFVGEVLPVEIRLYARQGRMKQHPQLAQEGFTVGKMMQQPQTRAFIGNQDYLLVAYKTYVAAAKNGMLKLGPATMPFTIPHPQSRISFFGDPVDWLDVNLTSEQIELNVSPLPMANVPVDFNGAVGNFTLEASLSTNAVSVGDPITVTVRIAGRGLIDALTVSCMEKWRDFKTYAPITRVETPDPLGLQGSKIFEQVVIPENIDVKELPPITFSFFDPEKRAYRTVSRPATPITVRPGATQAQPVIVATAASAPHEPKPATDIVHIKTRSGILGQIAPPLIQRPFFLAAQTLPIVAWIAMLVWRRRQEQLARNPRLRRRREVNAVVRAGLVELRRHAAANRSEEFHATAFRLLQEQLGERLDTPASGITEAVIEERLRPRSMSTEALDLLRELFQACNQARYAPQRSALELESLVPRVEAALAAAQSIKDADGVNGDLASARSVLQSISSGKTGGLRE